MLIVGSKGFAKELLQNFRDLNKLDELVFFDDKNPEINWVFNKFIVLKDEKEVSHHFTRYGKNFVLGVGNPIVRYEMAAKFQKIGGILQSSISLHARIGSFDVEIGEGCTILANSIISNNVIIGDGCLIYYNSIITHDCQIGNFVEISPAANILGRCKIGNFSHIGANATILPDIKIGENVIVGAGAVVTKNVASNSVVAGVPAVLKGIRRV